MTEKLEAPTLPKGYRFKVKMDYDGEIIVEMQKRKMLVFWSYVYRSYVKTDTRPGEVQESVLKLMQSQTRWLAFDTKAAKEVLERRGKFNDEASKVMGCYPPKRFLGED